jgi:hypothetical protein
MDCVPHTHQLQGCRGSLPGLGMSPIASFKSPEKGCRVLPAGVGYVPNCFFQVTRKRGAGSSLPGVGVPPIASFKSPEKGVQGPPCRGLGCPQLPLFFLSAAGGGTLTEEKQGYSSLLIDENTYTIMQTCRVNF